MPNLSLPYQSGIAFELFFNKNLPSPTGLWLGLSSGVPNNLFNGAELNVSNYARQSIGTGVNNWSFILNSGLVYNNNQITFPVALAYWSWVSGAVIYDSFYAGGNPVFWTPVNPPKEIGINDQFYTPTSGLSIQVH